MREGRQREDTEGRRRGEIPCRPTPGPYVPCELQR